MSGIRFEGEFKRGGVAEVVDHGYSIADVSERFGIGTKSLDAWKAPFSQPRRQFVETTEQAAEIRRLDKDLARAPEEREISRKATTAYIARDAK